MQTNFATDITRHINIGANYKQQVDQWMKEVKGTSIFKNIR